jgi:hypothetical protein
VKGHALPYLFVCLESGKIQCKSSYYLWVALPWKSPIGKSARFEIEGRFSIDAVLQISLEEHIIIIWVARTASQIPCDVEACCLCEIW